MRYGGVESVLHGRAPSQEPVFPVLLPDPQGPQTFTLPLGLGCPQGRQSVDGTWGAAMLSEF